MPYFVEYLRGVRALRIAGILIALALFGAIILRLSLNAHIYQTTDRLTSILESSTTAHVSTQHLADGTIRTTIDDPSQRVHAVIDRRGNRIAFDATLPRGIYNQAHGGMNMGMRSIDYQANGLAHVRLTTQKSVDVGVGILFAISTVMGLIMATILAGPLGKENDGHLEIAWTKPFSRERTALSAIAVDVATIIVSQAAMVVAEILVVLLFVTPHIYVNGLTPWVVACALLGPIAWYTCLTALTSSLKRAFGMVIGLSWLGAAMVIPGVAAWSSLIPAQPFQAIHVIFRALMYVDPIAYLSLHGDFSGTGMSVSNFTGSIVTSVWALLALAVGYALLSVLQWRRAEA